MTKAAENQSEGVMVVGRGIEVTLPIREYIEGKAQRVEKHLPNSVMHMEVRIEVQKLSHSVDIVMHFSHFKVKVGATTENLYSAIDKAFARIEAKLRKWKGKMQDHHAKGVSVIEMEVNVLEGKEQEEDELDREIIEANNQTLESEYTLPKVVKKKKRPLKELTLEEAVMKMELSGDHFLIYRSEEEKQLKVLYRRRDQSYGIISLR